MAAGNTKFDWAITKKHVDSLTTYEEKIIYILGERERFKNRDISGENVVHRIYEMGPRAARISSQSENYADKCEDELDRLQVEAKYLGTSNSIVQQNEKNDDAFFPIDTLKSIILHDAIEAFIEIEKRLSESAFFNSEHVWQKEKEVLVSFILNLQQKGYIRKKGSLSATAHKRKIKEFFSQRYNIDISKQMQPKYIKNNKVIDKFPYPIDTI